MDVMLIFAISGCVLSAGVVYVVMKVMHFGESQLILDKLSKVTVEADATRKKLEGFTKYQELLEPAKQALIAQLKAPVVKVTREYVYSTTLGKEEFHLVANATAIMTYAVEFALSVDPSPTNIELKQTTNGLGLRINRPVLAADPVVKMLSHQLISAVALENQTALLPAVNANFADAARRFGNALTTEPAVQAQCKLKALECLRDALSNQPGVRHPPAIFVDFR